MKALQKRIRLWFLRRRINKSIRLLDQMDWMMRVGGWTRTERRQFWRDFTKKHDLREKVLNRMTL